jgi:molybdopterin molybdotransferase
LISVSQALEQLQSNARPICGSAQLGLDLILGRTLSSAILSPVNVPPYDNSAMDGYAVRAEDIKIGTGYKVSQRITAGTTAEPLPPGTTARIFTGAPVPDGADAVIMQEKAVHEDQLVQFTVLPQPGENIRRCGQDLQAGSEILPKGKQLRAQEIGLIASCGLSRVDVYKKLRVAILSTGDELIEPGEEAGPGKIFNSNRYLLTSLCRASGFEALDSWQIPDQMDQTVAALEKAASEADVILTTGGVSVGEEDHIRPAIERLGSLDMWKVAIKPGKPVALGKIGGTDLIGLPGNPSSVFATFLILALPRLRLLQGRLPREPRPEILQAGFSRKAVSRQEYLRAKKTPTGVEIHPNQSSGVLSSACWGDGFAVQPAGVEIKHGQPIEFFGYENLING